MKEKKDDFMEDVLGIVKEGKQYLVFTLDKKNYALLVSNIKEIIRMQSITKIPNVPNYIKGVINLRGDIVQIIDTRLRLNLDPVEYNKFSVIVVVDVEDTQFGITTDEVKGLYGIKDDEVKEVEGGDYLDNYLTGQVAVDEGIIRILDINKLMGQS
jgi:purine-binding chemotaxis protein CheW